MQELEPLILGHDPEKKFAAVRMTIITRSMRRTTYFDPYGSGKVAGAVAEALARAAQYGDELEYAGGNSSSLSLHIAAVSYEKFIEEYPHADPSYKEHLAEQFAMIQRDSDHGGCATKPTETMRQGWATALRERVKKSDEERASKDKLTVRCEVQDLDNYYYP